jgi:hypothetical protein
MAITLNGITTGLLGYSLRSEFLGDGLVYREVEVYDLELYATPSNLSGHANAYSEVEAHIKAHFALVSGDINVRLLDSPSDYTMPNDHLRVGKFNVQVELKRIPLNITDTNPELTGTYYKGLESTFFQNYSTILNNFSEDFSLETQENGNKVFGHSLSFALQSGGKAKAVEIASGIFAKDKDNDFGISSLVGISLADSGTHVNYYTETYDLIRNNFSFNKKREVLSASGTNYTYNLNHSVEFKPEGVIDVTERGNIQGRLSFTQAKVGLDELYPGAFNRCNAIYNTYKDFVAGATVSESLISFSLSSSKTFNKPALSVDYDVVYTNNPSIIAANSGSLEKVLEVDIDESRQVNINHTYNFLFLRNPVSANLDNAYISQIVAAQAASPTEVGNFYSSSVFYNPSWPNMNMVKMAATTPNRKKNFSVSFGYTNNPTFLVTVDGVTYRVLDYKINNTKPVDIINEYKVINRPNKESVLNYAYQTEKGSKAISLTAKVERVGNVITIPRNDLGTNINSLYKFAIGKIMEDFIGSTALALVYYLSDVKYRVTSDNELGIDLTVTYAVKKHTA